MGLKPLLLLYIVAACSPNIESARILGMFPLFAKSHHKIHQAVMKTLALAGHDVVVYSPFPLDNPPPNYTDVYLANITTEGKITATKYFLDIAKLPYWKCLDVMWIKDERVFMEFMQDEKIKALLSSKEKFDLVISEAFIEQEYALIFGHIFNAPTIAVQAFMNNGVVNSHAGNSLSLAHIPDVCSGYSHSMTFTERLLNSFSILRGLYLYYNEYIPRKERAMRRHFPDMPPLLDMTDAVSLNFVNDHLTAEYAQPRTPNIVPIAGIHIDAVKPLPRGIKSFMDEATDGVILFSLGTYVEDQLLPRAYFDTYINVFKQLRQRVLWKTRKEDIEGLPANVMTLKWMPQQDILAHPKCVLFITHGGLFSTHEAVHFSVPVIGIPQFFDQPRNVKFFQEQGVGVMIETKALSEAIISAAIHTVLSDSRYADNMRRLSRIFNDRPLTPAQSVVYWTEYVLRHGGAAHLKPASTRLRWYQLALLDVLAVLLTVALSLAAAVYVVVRTIIFRLKRGKEKKIVIVKKVN